MLGTVDAILKRLTKKFKLFIDIMIIRPLFEAIDIVTKGYAWLNSASIHFEPNFLHGNVYVCLQIM